MPSPDEPTIEYGISYLDGDPSLYGRLFASHEDAANHIRKIASAPSLARRYKVMQRTVTPRPNGGRLFGDWTDTNQ